MAVNDNSKKNYKLEPYKSINFVDVGFTNNIMETIKICLKQIKSEWCLINPITTIPIENISNEAFIEYGSKIIPKENWSSLVSFSKGDVFFYSKSDLKSYGKSSHPFTGRIFAKKSDLISAIKELDYCQLNDLQNLAEILFKKRKAKLKYVEWLDIGHLATYPSTRVSTISSRFFNNLIYRKEFGSIKKISNDHLKIKKEINYFKELPLEIKRFFPTVINFEFGKESSSYEMDYIGNPPLSEIFLFAQLGPNAFDRIIESIEFIFQLFYEKKPKVIENAKWLYTQKTNKRKYDLEQIIELKGYEILKKIYYSEFNINNSVHPSLRDTFNFLLNKLENFEKKRPIHFGHGDLCFNNILVDPITGRINLIDPKAEKHHSLKLFGLVDSAYDISKLNHSFEGLYDSIVNNLYTIDILGQNKYFFKVYKPQDYEYINNKFYEKIIKNRINKNDLKFLTGNLFLSMLPLHIDDPLRMLGLAIIGSMYLNKDDLNKIYQ